MKKIATRFPAINSERLTQAYNAGMVTFFSLAFFCTDASASAKDTAVSVFNILYGLLGVVGGVSLVAQVLNMKLGNMLSIQDPRKKLVETLIHTCIGFAVVAIVQMVKSFVSGSSSDISSV